MIALSQIGSHEAADRSVFDARFSACVVSGEPAGWHANKKKPRLLCCRGID